MHFKKSIFLILISAGVISALAVSYVFDLQKSDVTNQKQFQNENDSFAKQIIDSYKNASLDSLTLL